MFLLNKKLKYSDAIFYLLMLSTIYILIYNIFHYSPSLGYDAEAHFLYVDHIARYLPYDFNIPVLVKLGNFLIHLWPIFSLQ